MWTAVGHPGALPVSQRPRTGRGTAPSAPLGPPRAQHLAPAFSATPPQGWPQNTGSSVHLQSQQGSWGTTSPTQTAPTTPNCLSHRPWKEKQARPFPSHSRRRCHTHAAHMRTPSRSTVKTKCRGQDTAGRQSHGHGIWTKPGVESSLLNTSVPVPAPLSHPLQRLSVPHSLAFRPAHSTSKSSSVASHHRGRLPSRCPLQGLGSTLRRALPSCGQPVGPLAPASPAVLGGSASSSLSPLFTAPAPGRGGTVPAGCQ